MIYWIFTYTKRRRRKQGLKRPGGKRKKRLARQNVHGMMS
jgi:hypothetical protein